MVHTQSRTSLSLKEGGNPDPGCTVDGLWGHCAQRNEPDTEGQILPDSTHMRSLEESHSWGQKLGHCREDPAEPKKKNYLNQRKHSSKQEVRIIESFK